MNKTVLILTFLLVLTSFCYVHVKTVYAERYFSDGFEWGHTDLWDSKTGTVNVTTAHAYTGVYSANVSTETSESHYLTKNEEYTKLYFSARYYIENLIIPDEEYPFPSGFVIMEIETDGPVGLIVYVYQNEGNYYWRTKFYDAGGWSDLISTNAPQNDTSYWIELHWNHTGNDSFADLWIDSENVWNGTYPDAYSTVTSSVHIGCSYGGENNAIISSYFDDCVVSDSRITKAQPSDAPVVGPNPNPSQHRLWVTVLLNGEWVKGCNVTVKGGPDDRSVWTLTDLFGKAKFKVKTGGYEIEATYQQYRKTEPVQISKATDITINLSEFDYVRVKVPTVSDWVGWLTLPELDLTTETLLFLLLPLIVLVIYAVKKATEGPKKRWKYSYLR